ncbi:MAG: hypothetical protein C4518_12335 [Desulfobacteraceae bacterium]|nr:MAG: hypothetical protein C4518_12335 [Desulfobacteraceae bacterium]
MDEKTFKHEMEKAKTLKNLEPDRTEYWIGYQLGIHRAYYGEKFGTDEDHLLWIGPGASTGNQRRDQRHQGYKDGFSKKSLVNYGRDCMNDPIHATG